MINHKSSRQASRIIEVKDNLVFVDFRKNRDVVVCPFCSVLVDRTGWKNQSYECDPKTKTHPQVNAEGILRLI